VSIHVIALRPAEPAAEMLVLLARAHRRWCRIDCGLLGVLGVLGLMQLAALGLRHAWLLGPSRLSVTSLCLLAGLGVSTWTARQRRRAFDALVDAHNDAMNAEFLRVTGESCALRGVHRVMRDQEDG
jgi:hypothetical protein